MEFRLNEKYAVKLPVDYATAFDMSVAYCDPLIKGDTLTVIRHNPNETYPYQVRFSNGYVEVYNYEQLLELVGLTDTKEPELKEEKQMSNINVNITYVVTGYDDEVYTLYAGYDEEKANASTNDAIHLQDFHKEVWYDGKLVRKSFKKLNTSLWVEQEDKFKDVLMSAKHHVEQLEKNLIILDGIKCLLKPEDKEKNADKYIEISNHLNNIKHVMTDLQGY